MNTTTTDKESIDAIFSHNNLPPLFADTFRDLDIKWNKIEGINFDTVGRVLICHLIIEHYLNIFIELEISKDFDFTSARLTFNQKLKLISKIEPLKQRGIIRGIEIINKIRNRFSHNLKVEIDDNDAVQLKKVVDEIHEKGEADGSKYSNLALIELFTSTICAFLAGYCSATISKRKELRKLAAFFNDKMPPGNLGL